MSVLGVSQFLTLHDEEETDDSREEWMLLVFQGGKHLRVIFIRGKEIAPLAAFCGALELCMYVGH